MKAHVRSLGTLLMVFLCVVGMTNFGQAQQRPLPTPSAEVPKDLNLPMFIVEYDGSSSTMSSIERTEGVTIRHRYQTVNLVAISVTNGAERNVRNLSGVGRVIKDDLLQLNLEESHAQTQALIAQGNGKTGAGCGIAVLDNGIDDRHCMFSGKLTNGSGCFATDIVFADAFGPGIDLVGQSACPNGSGGSTTDATLANTYEVFEFFPDHGSNVAGIAAGASCEILNLSNGFAIETTPGGVASGAHIIPVNVFTRFTEISPSGSVPFGDFAFCSDILAGLEFVLMNKDALGVCVVNMSLGGGFTSAFCNTDFLAPVIDQLTAAGIAVAIATGNGGSTSGIGFPACVESAIAVGSVDDDGNRSSFSDHLDGLVDLMAPGRNINSAISNFTINPLPFSFTADFTGTSMATPTVAGAFAIIKAAHPDKSVAEILQALQDTGADVPGFATKSIRINDACQSLFPDPSISDPCSCTDPLNRRDRQGVITHFHDVLTINGAGPVILTATDGVMLKNDLTPFAVGDNLGTAAGTLNVDFFHAAGLTGTITVTIGGVPRTLTLSVCTAADCGDPIPTMSEWGLMIFGLLVLNISVGFLRRKESILA